jgi:hypothetical protein
MNGKVSYTCTYGKPIHYDGTTDFANDLEAWNFSSSTCTYTTSMFAPTTTISSSTSIAIYGSMTAGEILMIMMMFVLIMIELLKMLVRTLDRVKTKKKFLGYSNSEVEIKEEF